MGVTGPSSLAARGAAALFGAAGMLGVLTLILPHPAELRDGPLLLLSVFALVSAAATHRLGRLTPSAARLVSLTSVLLVGAAVTATGGVPSAAAMLFAWPVLFAAYLLSFRDLVGHLGVVAVVYAALVLAAPEPLPLVSHWVTAVVTLAVAGLIVERLRSRLQAMADTDALTGAPNRRALTRELARATALAQRSKRALTLAVIDIDHFKAYNDTHGHEGGDRLLVAAVDAWRATLRATDVLARLGGEEFVVVIPDSTADDAVPLLERLRAATPGGATCSIGVAEWQADERTEQTIARADAALYRAKTHGRDRVLVARQGELSLSAEPSTA